MGQKGRSQPVRLPGLPVGIRNTAQVDGVQQQKPQVEEPQPLSAAICLTILNFPTPGGPHIQVFYRSNLRRPAGFSVS